MPFPPTFTNVWDITTPPDTQQANLLGQDLRNLKNDVMQRMSLLSGTTANMPTPETVNATWGGAGFGLVFFATDTKLVWQWSGAAWVQIGNISGSNSISNVIALATPGSVNINSGSQTGLSNSLAGALSVGDIIHVYTRIRTVANNEANTVQLLCNGTVMSSIAMSANGESVMFISELMVISAVAAVPVSIYTTLLAGGSEYIASVPIVAAGPNVFSVKMQTLPVASTYSNDILAVRVGR
jgi:hypothetical protein